MAKVTAGVYPVFDIVFSIRARGLVSSEDDTASTRDIESFFLSIESNVEKWSPMDQGGWGRALAIAKTVTVSLKGKRSVGGKENDYACTILWKDGLDRSTEYSIESLGDPSVIGNCVLDVKAVPGGGSINVAALELGTIFGGKPTFIPAPVIPEGDA